MIQNSYWQIRANPISDKIRPHVTTPCYFYFFSISFSLILYWCIHHCGWIKPCTENIFWRRLSTFSFLCFALAFAAIKFLLLQPESFLRFRTSKKKKKTELLYEKCPFIFGREVLCAVRPIHMRRRKNEAQWDLLRLAAGRKCEKSNICVQMLFEQLAKMCACTILFAIAPDSPKRSPLYARCSCSLQKQLRNAHSSFVPYVRSCDFFRSIFAAIVGGRDHAFGE